MPSELILVVDDNEAGRYAKCRILRQAGFQVKEAGTGGEALQIIAAERPDLVCLDVRLPDTNGFEVCRRIKADPMLHTMVLQMSASFVGNEDKVRGLEGGADGYLVSPVEPEEFLATVRSLLRIQQVEDELRLSAGQWRVTFDAINDGILLMDEKGCVLRCNHAISEIIGKPFEAIVGKAYSDLLPPASDHAGAAVLMKWPPTAREETVLEIGEKWFQATMHPVAERGLPRGAVCVMTNITGRRRQEEEIRHLNTTLEARIRELQQSRLELHEKISDLEQFEDVVVGRELKMIELEQEIERLKAENGKKS